MCEDCIRRRDEAWATIRDLMNFRRNTPNGPASAEFAEYVAKMRVRADAEGIPGKEFNEIIDCVRAQLIADACVAVAMNTDCSVYHRIPAHMIMGKWAGDLMREDMLDHLQNSLPGEIPELIKEFLNSLSGDESGEEDGEE